MIEREKERERERDIEGEKERVSCRTNECSHNTVYGLKLSLINMSHLMFIC